MTRRLKTKLLKIVIKRSELMHDRFRGSSWTNKISQTDKKSLFVNKTGEKFRSKLLKLSIAKTWPSIQKEWIVVKQVQLTKRCEQCLCGRANLKVTEESKQTFLKVIQRLNDEQNIEGIVLGCTEIPVLIKQNDIPHVLLFDSTQLHAQLAVDYQLGRQSIKAVLP
ncbi:unnamed protein product [Rotaria magnacalcarata]|uniref:Aspartate racemase n=2 Tax=Rotaria magnacalcarata TaxID=392030 RepID=A0A816UHS4_9BILA|nr:unnamed protein product [Rotaria magnacalcarata]CAF4342672.1 unnamed protein product [Rotaria magnacalcarata]